MGPVRRSYFVPRLGKRQSWMGEEESFLSTPPDLNDSNDVSGEAEAITPAEIEYFQKVWAEIMGLNGDYDDEDDLFNQFFDPDLNEDDDSAGLMGQGVTLGEEGLALDRNSRAPMSFSPRLGKKSFSFSPRLGKKSFSFVPRLGKRAYSFSPRLGKKLYSFAPRLGKKSYSFAPRLGKKSYTFAPRLGKKAFSFAPRLGKKSYTFAPRLGK